MKPLSFFVLCFRYTVKLKLFIDHGCSKYYWSSLLSVLGVRGFYLEFGEGRGEDRRFGANRFST